MQIVFLFYWFINLENLLADVAAKKKKFLWGAVYFSFTVFPMMLLEFWAENKNQAMGRQLNSSRNFFTYFLSYSNLIKKCVFT